MHPVLIRIGPLSIHTYGVLVAAGFLLGLALAVRQGKKEGIPPERIIDIGFYALLAAIVGSRLLFVLINAGHYLKHPLDIIKIWEGGLVFYGGLLLAAPVALWYIRKHSLDRGSLMDIFAPSMAIGHAVGRLGCFSAGCCYGKPASVPWAVTFLDPESLARVGIPLHPTQVYESLGEFLNFLILITLRRHQSFKGQLFWTYIFLYSVLRFTVEFFRGDVARGYIVAGISVSQGISMIIGLAAIVVIVKLMRRKTAH
ncbi:MAG: prolipoprotein diacylglyceryl transferase [Nitrospirae bacterium]|nr:prolipoprotein diacylglyceryl transferase [Nitrospirota bacterium]MCL5423096.1 prolipoprotein diacylglyceryl transferase [Nitrospirota bacterium]